MKALIVSMAVLFAAGCAMQPMSTGQPLSTGGIERYECYTYVDEKHVLTLPLPEPDAEIPLVEIIFQGDFIPTLYVRDGLTQLWVLEESLYIQLDPDFVARYMDFRSAEEGEARKAEAVFKCKKRR